MDVYTDSIAGFDQELSGNSVAIGLFLPPGHNQQLIKEVGALESNLAAQLFYKGRARVSITYSSVFGDAWRIDGTFSLPESVDPSEARIQQRLMQN